MVTVKHRFFNLIIRFIPFIAPFTAWLYRSKFSRKMAVRMLFLTAIAPVAGYFRRPYVLRQYRQQLQSENESKESEVKQSLNEAQLDFVSQNKNFDYMVIVRSQKSLEDDQLFQKQKFLFNLNNEILQKSSENQNYFEGVKFVFLGEERIFEALSNNLSSQQQNSFDFIKKDIKTGGMSLPKQDIVFLIAKDQSGDNKILMQWPFNKQITLKSILRQISKHKHKKYVQSMNF